MAQRVDAGDSRTSVRRFLPAVRGRTSGVADREPPLEADPADGFEQQEPVVFDEPTTSTPRRTTRHRLVAGTDGPTRPTVAARTMKA